MSLRLCSFFQFFLLFFYINNSTGLCLIDSSVISILPIHWIFYLMYLFFVLKFSFDFFIVYIFAEKKIKFWLCHLRVLTFPSLMEHGYNSSSRVFYNSHFWAVSGLAPVGYFFPLQPTWFSLFFVCWVILDRALDTLNIMAWDFGLESSGECWFCCFSRRSSLP